MTQQTKNFCVQDVIHRIHAGDFPVVNSSYSCASVFDDGTQIPHQVMQNAAFASQLGERPARGVRWACPLARVVRDDSAVLPFDPLCI